MSLILFVFGAFLLLQAAAQHQNHEGHRVEVGVYYESLCPDSRKFFTQQLYPSLQGNLSKYVNLTLVPFGKSKIIGENTFECHHGEAECKGNKIQACGLKNIENGEKTVGLGYNKVAVGFINCLMDKSVNNGSNTVFPTKECAELNQVSRLSDIDNCAEHSDGSELLTTYGLLTKKVADPLSNVPTIVFQNNYKREDSSLAQKNFVSALCQYIEGTKPVECLRNGVNGSLTGSLMALLVAFVTTRYFR